MSSENVRAAPIFDPKITPQAIFYDPTLLATTPDRVIARSGMNGFNHGVEMLYSRNANPITDASASHGLCLLHQALPSLGNRDVDHETRGQAQLGVVLTSRGLIDPDSNANKYNLIHAFGHIVSRFYEIQQGAVHGIVTPHVLRYIFDNVDGRRQLLARSLDVDYDSMGDEEVASEIIMRVTELRDRLDLPTSLKEVPGLEQTDLSHIAESITEDVGLLNQPAGIDPTADDLERVLRAAW